MRLNSKKGSILIILFLSLAFILLANSFLNKEKKYSLELFGTKVGTCFSIITESEAVFKGKSIVNMKTSQRNRIVNVKFESLTDYDKEALQPVKYVCRITTDNEKTSIITIKINENNVDIKFTSSTRKYNTNVNLPDKFFILDNNFILDQYEIFLNKLRYPSKSSDDSSVTQQTFNILVPQETSVISKTKKLVVNSIIEEKLKIGDKDVDTYKVNAEFEEGVTIKLWATKEGKELVQYSLPSQNGLAILQ